MQYDDLWLSQSLRLTGTQESPSRNPGTVAENSPMDTSLGPGTDTVPARTGDNQTEYDTPL